MQEEILFSLIEELIDDKRYYFMLFILNLVNIFLYMINIYIIVLIVDDYFISFGVVVIVCGVVIGVMVIVQVFFLVYFSVWLNRLYFRFFVFSSIVFFVGNVLYVLVYDFNLIWIFLIGRLFCG